MRKFQFCLESLNGNEETKEEVTIVFSIKKKVNARHLTNHILSLMSERYVRERNNIGEVKE